MSDLKIVLARTYDDAERYARERGWSKQRGAGTRWLFGCAPLCGIGVDRDDIKTVDGFWERRDAQDIYDRALLRVKGPLSR